MPMERFIVLNTFANGHALSNLTGVIEQRGSGLADLYLTAVGELIHQPQDGRFGLCQPRVVAPLPDLGDPVRRKSKLLKSCTKSRSPSQYLIALPLRVAMTSLARRKLDPSKWRSVAVDDLVADDDAISTRPLLVP